jgi:serine phosphatase RsbU (regulator of sigma subunit)
MQNLHLSGTVGDQFSVWPLDGPAIGIGRSSRNAIQIVDGTVSKDHAEISKIGEQYFIRDLGSRNGTRLNGTVVHEPVPLKADDRIEIGHVPLRVTVGHPEPRTQLAESDQLQSSVKIRAAQILEQRDKTPTAGTHLVHLLAEVGRLLIRADAPLAETCDEILKVVERAVPSSRLIMMLRESEKAELVQIASRTSGGGANAPMVLSRAIIRTVLDEVTSVITSDASLDPRFMGSESVMFHAVRSALAVPLFDNEKVLGLLYADQKDPTFVYNSEHLEVLTLVANMAAVKITNARLFKAAQDKVRMEQELKTAMGMQRSLLPATPPSIEGYRFHAQIEACYEVGGDLYDFHRLSDGTLYFMVGDVSGKGMGAALLMSSALASARVLYEMHSDPAPMVRQLSGLLHRTTEARHFITAFVGMLDPASGTLRYVNAGHNAPLLLSGGAVRELPSAGPPLAVLPDFPYSSETLVLAPGDVLLLYTDGVPEAQRGNVFFGEQPMIDLLLSEGTCLGVEELSGRIIQRVDEFMAGEHRPDDVTLVALSRDPA